MRIVAGVGGWHSLGLSLVVFKVAGGELLRTSRESAPLWGGKFGGDGSRVSRTQNPKNGPPRAGAQQFWLLP